MLKERNPLGLGGRGWLVAGRLAEKANGHHQIDGKVVGIIVHLDDDFANPRVLTLSWTIGQDVSPAHDRLHRNNRSIKCPVKGFAGGRDFLAHEDSADVGFIDIGAQTHRARFGEAEDRLRGLQIDRLAGSHIDV